MRKLQETLTHTHMKTYKCVNPKTRAARNTHVGQITRSILTDSGDSPAPQQKDTGDLQVTYSPLSRPPPSMLMTDGGRKGTEGEGKNP